MRFLRSMRIAISVTPFAVTMSQQICPSSCDLDGRITDLENQIRNLQSRLGWSLIFRVSAGYGSSLYDAWASKGPINENRVAATDLSMTFDGVYKSSLIGQFDQIRIDQFKVSVFVKGEEKMYFIFDGRGMKDDSWFSNETLLDSSYGNIRSQSFNFFSIPGHQYYGRRFFVNQNYGGCTRDRGWLAVVDIESNPCQWHEKQEGVYFLYCPGQAPCLMHDESAIGDTFAVFIKTKPW